MADDVDGIGEQIPYPIPLVPPVTKAVVPSRDHFFTPLLALLLSASCMVVFSLSIKNPFPLCYVECTQGFVHKRSLMT